MLRQCRFGVEVFVIAGLVAGCARVRSLNQPEDRVHARVDKLELGRSLRLTFADRDTVEGILMSRQWPNLMLKIKGTDQVLDGRQIETIWTQQVSKRKGQLIGAGIGAVPFAILFYIPKEPFCFEYCEPYSERERIRHAVLGIIPGAFLGAAIGTFVSRGTLEWQQVYP